MSLLLPDSHTAETQLLNRNPPFGTQLLAAASQIPQYSLNITENKASPSKNGGPVEVELSIQCSLAVVPSIPRSASTKKPSHRGTWTTVLTMTSDDILLDFRRIPWVYEPHQK